MSVLILDEKEMNDLFNIILHLNSKQSVFDGNQRYETDQIYQAYKNMKDKDENFSMEYLEENKIRWFIDRIYFANQIAYYYQYKHNLEEDFKYNHIGESLTISIMNRNERKALKALKSLTYNLYTNNGNSFISREDMEFIERIEIRLLNNLSNIYN